MLRRSLRALRAPSTHQLCPRCPPPLSPRSLYTLTSSYTTSIRNTRPFSRKTTHPRRRRPFATTSTLYATPPSADEHLTTLTDLYGTARDEFEIAAEETEKKTVYAADDRVAARAAFEELKAEFEKVLKESTPEVGKEVRERVGARVRELEAAVGNLEERALEDH